MVTKAAREGDPAAIELFELIGGWLGQGMADLAAVLDPGCFVIGGGVSEAGDLLLEPRPGRVPQALTGRGHRPEAVIARRAGQRRRPGRGRRPGAANLGTTPPAGGRCGKAGTENRVTEVRVLSYNVRSLRDDRRAVARVIRACRPDVVCVQEAPRFLRWQSTCAWLARESGLVVLTGGRPAGAMLLLGDLRARVLATRNVLLRRTPGLHQRGLAMAVLEVAGARFAVAGMHLSLNEEERGRQVGEVLGHLRELGEPHTVLAGDVNEPPSKPRWRRLAAELQDGWAVAPRGGEFTFPSWYPDKRIDGVFATAGIEVLGCGVPEDIPGLGVASDHRPVLATLSIPR